MRISQYLTGVVIVLASSFLAQRTCRSQEEEKVSPEAEKSTELTPRQRLILGLFSANRKTFEKDRIHLEYEFESQNEDLVLDWLPALKNSRNRIRWLRGIEGTMTSVEHGICVSNSGEWYHKAVFLPDIEVKVELMSNAAYRAGSLLGPVFFSEKKRASIGATAGCQAICVRGYRLAKPPYPPDRNGVVMAADRQTFGYKYNGKVLEVYRDKARTADTSEVPKFTKGFDRGHAGLIWCGSVQAFVFKITIEGKLDPKWVAKQLGEKPKKGKK